MFARAREAAGTGEAVIDAGVTLRRVLDDACSTYGADFAAVLARSRVWVNGDEAVDGDATVLADGDEVAILPPVSGGAGTPLAPTTTSTTSTT
jgi:molybdopterin synthase sulfur carrier subunit